MTTSPPSDLATDAAADTREARVHFCVRLFRRRVYLWPLLVTLALALPKLHQGGWTGDSPWYAAIALNAFRAQFEPSADSEQARATTASIPPHPGDRWYAGLWVLPGLGGSPSSTDGGGVNTPDHPGGGGEPYFNKPPLAFWLNGVWLWALGPTIFAARAGCVVACVLCVFLTTFIARRVTRDDLLACTSGVILAFTWEFVRHARAFSLDLWLVAALLAGIAGFASIHRSGARREWLLGWSLLGAGVGAALLTKPLVGLLALPIVGLWQWLSFTRAFAPEGAVVSNEHSARSRPTPRSTWSGFACAVLVAALIALPWHLSMHLRFPSDFAAQYFGRQIVDRAAGEGADFNRSASDPLFYLRLLATAYWPWLPLSVLGVFGLLARVRASRDAPTQAHSGPTTSPASAARAIAEWPALRLLALGTLWTLVWVIALSAFADKRPRYALVIYPSLAWCAAAWLVALSPASIRRATERALPWAVAGAMIVGLVLFAAPVRMHKPEARQWVALFQFLRGAGPGEEGRNEQQLFAGALDGQRAARLYLEMGRWPVMPHNARGQLVNEPPQGSLILYHRRDGRLPGPGEEIVWHMDDLTLTRLTEPPWAPMTISDPGE